MHRSRRLLVLLLGLACAGLAGCATLRRDADEVTVGLADLRPLDATAFESRLVLVVRVTNAGPAPLSLSGARHRLTLNGHALGAAVTSEPLELAGLSSATQEVVFNLSHLALLPLVGELRREPAARYEIESTFFGAGVFSRGIVARQEGRIDLAAFARAAEPAAAR